jgi:hypothetical protein
MRLGVAIRYCFCCSLIALAHPLPYSSALACAGPPVVFFESGKAELSVTSKTTLDMAAEGLERDQHRVLITGHADRSGPPKENLELSERRQRSCNATLCPKASWRRGWISSSWASYGRWWKPTMRCRNIKTAV